MGWMESFLSILRFVVPLVMLNLLVTQAHKAFIPVLNIEISAVLMRCVIIGTHATSAIYGLNEENGRGWLYELCCCFLATEIVLFIYFIQYQFEVASTMLATLVCGAVVLLTYGKKQLKLLYANGYIPQSLMDDIISSSKSNKSPNSVLSVALRRYMTIATATLFAIPSMATIFIMGTDGVMQHGNFHAIIEAGNENQMLLNMETIQLLDEDKWNRLTVQDRVNVLQVIADIEANHMNIAPVMVVNYHLSECTIGSYDHAKRQVQIDMEKHEGYEPLEYVNTILHECRHAYQHDCVDSLDWNSYEVQNGIYYAQARQWRYEHENYIGLSVDRDAYYDQAIEKDARYYAEEGIMVYQQYIYLSNLPTR